MDDVITDTNIGPISFRDLAATSVVYGPLTACSIELENLGVAVPAIGQHGSNPEVISDDIHRKDRVFDVIGQTIVLGPFR